MVGKIGRQKKMSQMKEQEKSSEKELNEMKATEFKTMLRSHGK